MKLTHELHVHVSQEGFENNRTLMRVARVWTVRGAWRVLYREAKIAWDLDPANVPSGVLHQRDGSPMGMGIVRPFKVGR